jgi:hypothetical protein
MKSEKEIIFLWEGEMVKKISRKKRRNSFLIDPKWTIYFQEKEEEIAF